MSGGGEGAGTRWVGLAAIVVGLVLLGLCASNWNGDTGATMGHALSAYNSGDRSGFRGIGADALQQSSQTGVEGIAGVFWLAIGVFLVKKAGGTSKQGGYDRRLPPRR